MPRMTIRAMKTVLSLIFLLAFATAAQAGEFKVTKVVDGDTLKAIGHDVEIVVRLMAIDAPETAKKKGEPGQPYSQAAKKLLTKLVYGKVVEVKGYGTDRYNRVLAVVYVAGKNVNLEVVRAGLAEVYRGKMRSDFDLMPYHAAEREARMLQKGIWSIGNIHISPRLWRKGKR